MAKTLTDEGILSAAKYLGVEPATIRAVAEVESAGDGFLPDGRPKILFERHKFHKFTKGEYDASHPDISAKTAGGYGAGGAHQWKRFSEAMELDPEAAMKSASWGKFQIMGFNHKAAGFDTVDDFVDAMKASEDEQLKAFVQYIKSNLLDGELKNHDWAGFARQYNGADYKINRYDTKLAAAYKKFKAKESPAGSAISGAAVLNVKPLVAPEPEIKPADAAKGVTAGGPPETPAGDTAQGNVVESGTPPPTQAVEVKASRPSIKSTAVAILTFLMGPLSYIGIDAKQVGEFAKGNLTLAIKVGAGLAFVVIAIWVWDRAMDRANMRTLKVIDKAADKDSYNVRLVGGKLSPVVPPPPHQPGDWAKDDESAKPRAAGTWA